MRRGVFHVLVLALGCAAGFSPKAQAEIHRLYRGTRAQAMGGAGVAVMGDPSAGMWLNPALVGAAEDSRLYYAAVDAEAAGNLIKDTPAIFAIANDFSPSSVNELLGRNIYGRAQITPSFISPGFGLGVLVDGQSAFYAKNTALPQVTLGHQTTMGGHAAVAFPLQQRRRGRRNRGETYIGGAVKALWRRGGYYRLPTADVIAASQDGQSGLNGIVGNFEFGLGADVGIVHRRRLNRRFVWTIGSSFVDAGDTGFGGKASDADGNWTVGASGEYEVGAAKITVAYDLANITQDLDWKLKNHIGAEVAFPVVKLYVGINQTYLTYGLGLNLWIIDIVAHSYAEELSTAAFQEANRRFMLRVALNLVL